MAQVAPFQRSAKFTWPELALYWPTAVQAVGVVHDTDCRTLSEVLAGLGVGWIVQVVPFQRSAKVSSLVGELV